MEELQLIATTAFGLEAVLKREAINLGFKDIKVSDGRVRFKGSIRDMVMANMHLRTADRILIELGRFEAKTFEELFDKVYDIDWPQILTEDAKFLVNGRSVKSKLFSISDCQRITEKAIIEKLKTKYNISYFQKSGPRYSLEVSLLKDMATITLDTSGESLHKRGYRKKQRIAPIKETMASAMVQLSFWKADRPLFDPFCGSGTILIEAAMLAKNIAPGIDRKFDFENWEAFDKDILKKIRQEALANIDHDLKLDIIGTDIDKMSINFAKDNAFNIGLEDSIEFIHEDFRNLKLEDNYGVLITNPPYGERLNTDDIKSLYVDLGYKMRDLKTWSEYIITSERDFEKLYKRRADRKRKLFNGRIKVDYYQFYGLRPPKN
ncbi:MAG: class I SAM-dependent RNA methyltransferase [Tissierellia bacterium]|nr:class I SAM-dependent RNA methyltransferase [Tissierellia bacterium]